MAGLCRPLQSLQYNKLLRSGVFFSELALSAGFGVLLGLLTKIGQHRRSQVKLTFVHVAGYVALCEQARAVSHSMTFNGNIPPVCCLIEDKAQHTVTELPQEAVKIQRPWLSPSSQ